MTIQNTDSGVQEAEATTLEGVHAKMRFAMQSDRFETDIVHSATVDLERLVGEVHRAHVSISGPSTRRIVDIRGRAASATTAWGASVGLGAAMTAISSSAASRAVTS